jgi:TolA-binding protein
MSSQDFRDHWGERLDGDAPAPENDAVPTSYLPDDYAVTFDYVGLDGNAVPTTRSGPDGNAVPVTGVAPDGQAEPEEHATEHATQAKPAKATVAAVLLNLTGLGLGYAYLRRRGLACAAVLLTGALVAGAYLADGVHDPWLWRGVALAWLALLGTHAGLLARAHPRPAARVLPAVAGIAAVAVVAGGYVGYTGLGRTAYADGIAAQRAGDCATAIDRFDAVTGPYRLTLSADVDAATARRTECAAFQPAADAQRLGDHGEAITRYEAFVRTYPRSELAQRAHNALAAAYVDDARGATTPFVMPESADAVDTLLTVRREFGDTPAADRALDLISEAFTSAAKSFADGEFCDVLPALTYFAGLDPSSAGDIVPTANAHRADALLRCGLDQLRGGKSAAAVTNLDTFVQAYPKHKAIAQAKSALIAAKVAVAAKVRLPVPPPLGGNSPGTLELVVYNDSSDPLRLLLAGPTAHDVSLPGCRSCPRTYSRGDPKACASLSGLPSVKLRLNPGTYRFTTVDTAIPATDKEIIRPGYVNHLCMFESPTP